jgi:beta-phosphoglucomutase-like phosphatase (HAD superfamily)
MINSQKTKAVFFDFDGVLCTGRFYVTLKKDYPLAWKFINENVFGGPKYADRWMRGEFNYNQINRIISDAAGVPFDILSGLFKDSVRQMRINQKLIQFALDLKQRGIKTALVTSNMDVFNEITVPEKKLAGVFPLIMNSFDYKILKHEENEKLIDIALEKLGLSSYHDTWLIDDSTGICDMFNAKGGRAYRYSGQKDFDEWRKRPG